MTSLYIHIPFCVKKCLYCDFYSIEYEKRLAVRFMDILCRQIKAINSRFESIYIGGGTPSVLDAQLLEKLLKSLRSVSCGVEEFTIEVNPESVTEEKLELFLKYGINRISIGVQSFNDKKLTKLGRIHPAQKAIDSIAMARRNGFVNISIDLIFGIWNETLSDWKEELKRAVSLPIKHISCYSLSYEKHTKLFALLGCKKIIPQSDEITAKMYKYTLCYLERNKFRHYEVSNFSKSGFECRHNLSYWQNNPYVGLGPSAVSYQNGIRAKNTPDVEEYIEMAQRNKPTIISTEKLSLRKQAKETAAIKIRTREGIVFSWFKERTGFDFMELEGADVNVLLKQALVKYKKMDREVSGIALTRKGFLFCDSVSAQLL